MVNHAKHLHVLSLLKAKQIRSETRIFKVRMSCPKRDILETSVLACHGTKSVSELNRTFRKSSADQL